jgi:hypothetical protein
MKIYVFGAGASHGSQDTQNSPHLVPPLIDQLFDSTYHSYATDVFVDPERISELKEEVGDAPLEEWLTSQWTLINEPHGKEALAYGKKLFGDLALYVWWMMSNISATYNSNNVYSQLLKKLRKLDDKEEQAFVNFNYDLFLDKALSKMYGYDLSGQIQSYTTYNYLKPHGSVNWFLNKRDTDKKIEQQDRHGGLEVKLNKVAGGYFNGERIEGGRIVLDPLNENLYDIKSLFSSLTFSTGTYGYPLVMLPLASKMYEVVEDFIGIMNLEFKRIFSQATEIYVIGYRANDDIFQEMVKHCAKETTVNVVSMGDSAEIMSRILKSSPNLKEGEKYDNGFSNYVSNL